MTNEIFADGTGAAGSARASGTEHALAEVRAAIDDIDRRIVDLLAERHGWVERAGELKRDEQGVRAPDRVEQVVEKVRSLAEQAGASPDVVERTYRAMIAAFVDLELIVHRRGRS